MICGFVGLGEQGAPIARRMSERFAVKVWARRAEACSLVPQAQAMQTLAELGAACDIVSLCVRSDDDVRETVAVLASSMAAGGTIIIHNTVAPQTVLDLERDLAPPRLTLIDAPVSGGPDRAERGEMVVFAGCDSESLARVRPVLESFATLIEHLGPAGAGQKMKLINNGLFFANAAAGAAAMRLATELGLDSSAAGRVLSAGTGKSAAFDILDIAGGGLAQMRSRTIMAKDLHHLADISAGKSAEARLFVGMGARFPAYVGWFEDEDV